MESNYFHIVADPLEAYGIFVQQAEEKDEIAFVRRYKRFFLREWKHFVDSFLYLKR
jgi:hypothetical protein